MMNETVVTVESGNRNNAQAPPPKPAAPQQSSAGPLSWITFNTAYFQSVPGLLKLIELVSELKIGRAVLGFNSEKIYVRLQCHFEFASN